ncbi:ketose-bisphosphate aldolase [Tractidigestivibacter scatoligenes]|jgi:fructose-bisphosphate aldolase class II|uniref:Ketose-bisphosphate aldolase n=2 Tax=Tractidigestivibacter scatoligenes TaxID=1299998 RepID=A0A117J4Y7_TRASO|nr:ketose-bisphosphate aldolase [Tractidigestivibacter scatoligenes]
MLVNMTQILKDAEAGGYAIGCINTPNLETIRGVLAAAEEVNVPIIIDHAQVHDENGIKVEVIGPLMVEYAKKAKVPVCVHVDHGSDFSFIIRCLRAGFSSVMYDLSALPYEQNLSKVKEFTEYAHKAGISVEAELGIMTLAMGEGWTHETIKTTFTDPQQAADFAERSGVDALAVCFGTAHGIYAEPPVLDIQRVRDIRAAMPDTTRVVMHGGSGVDEKQVQEAITAGVSKLNYYSYLGMAATENMAKMLSGEGRQRQWHENQEAQVDFIKEYAKHVLTVFKNGK